jgi:hypothetical protein
MLRLALSLTVLALVACGPAQKPMEHPGLGAFGTACTASHTCGHDLECIATNGYGGETGNCEKRCNYDDDCGLNGRCKMVEGAPAPVCRAKG